MRSTLVRVLALVGGLAACLPALAQSGGYRDPAGVTVPLVVQGCLNNQGRAVPCPTPPGTTPGSPAYVTPGATTRVRKVCVLPAYGTGGTATCTTYNSDGTTTAANIACAANVACKIADPLAGRRVAEFTNRTQNSTIDIGYTPSVAPGFGKGYDGPGIANGQGGSGAENTPPHAGAYYAASNTANAVLVFVQGQ